MSSSRCRSPFGLPSWATDALLFGIGNWKSKRASRTAGRSLLWASLLAVWAAGALAVPAAAQFTRQEITYIVDPNEGAEARAQYVYHYFKKDRDPNLKIPQWVDEVLDAMLSRPVWQDPEEGVLNEAQLWQAPVSVLYEFFEHTRKTFPPEFNGSLTPPGALIKDYEDSRVRFQMALDRLYRARLGDSLGGRGRAVLAVYDLILREMESVLDALTSQDAARYHEAVVAVAALTHNAFEIFHRSPRGYEPPTTHAPSSMAGPLFLKVFGLMMIFGAMWFFAQAKSESAGQMLDHQIARAKHWANEFNRQFVAIKVQYLILTPMALGLFCGIITLNIFGILIFTLGGIYLGIKLPEWTLSYIRTRRGKRVEAQLMDAMILMSNALKSGLDIVQGFELVQRDLVPPISEEFGLVLKNYQLGTPFEKALLGMEERIASRLLSYLIKAVIIQRSVGGNLTKIFDRIVENIRDESKLEQKAQSLTAQQRIQAIVVGIMPWAMLALMWIFQPDVMSAYYFSFLGVVTIGFCAVWMTIGMGIVRKLADIQV
ncbi:MAG: type II secretion system F family protein [Elusimicrobia bacterium]|nr:type II secretion system F family protein [Elusimicrobiota bacterium]